MVFDITSTDSAYEFFNSFLGYSGSEWIDKVILECDDDIDVFVEQYSKEIALKDINSMRFAAFHITTSNDDCAEIKTFGIRSLRDVLSFDSDLNRFLKGKDLHFNLVENTLLFMGKTYDVDYSHC